MLPLSQMKGTVYKLTSGDLPPYFGSTSSSLKTRLWAHKSGYNAYKKGKARVCKSSVLFDNGDVEIHEVETIEYTDVKELRRLERKYIEENECINMIVPTRTHAEYVQDNPKWREYNKEYAKQYRKDGRDKSKEKYKQKVICPLCLKKISLRTFKYKHPKVCPQVKMMTTNLSINHSKAQRKELNTQSM